MKNELPANDQQNIQSLLSIGIEGELKRKMYTIITWSRITAIGGFVNLGLNLFSSIIVFNNAHNRDLTWLLFSSVISLAISFFLNFFLFLFSRNLKTSLVMEDQNALIAAAMQLKAYIRMLGILLVAGTLLVIVSYGYLFLLSNW